MINIPEVLIHLRHKVVEQQTAGLRILTNPEAMALKSAALIFRSERRFRAARSGSAWPSGRWSRGGQGEGWIGWLPGLLGGWTQVRDLREMPKQTFREWFEEQRSPTIGRRPAMPLKSPLAMKSCAASAPRSPRRPLMPPQSTTTGVRSRATTSAPLFARPRDDSGFAGRPTRDYDATVVRAHPGCVGPEMARMIAARNIRRIVVPAGLPEALGEPLPDGIEFIIDHGLTAIELDAFEGVLAAHRRHRWTGNHRPTEHFRAGKARPDAHPRLSPLRRARRRRGRNRARGDVASRDRPPRSPPPSSPAPRPPPTSR